MDKSEIDFECYKNLITTRQLNHDRYKSYFNCFLVLHIGIVLAIVKSRDIPILPDILVWLKGGGLIMAVIWFLVMAKICVDIRKAWGAIEKYESEKNNKINYGVSESKLLNLEEVFKLESKDTFKLEEKILKCLDKITSKIKIRPYLQMLFFPIFFIGMYIYLIIHHIVDC